MSSKYRLTTDECDIKTKYEYPRNFETTYNLTYSRVDTDKSMKNIQQSRQ